MPCAGLGGPFALADWTVMLSGNGRVSKFPLTKLPAPAQDSTSANGTTIMGDSRFELNLVLAALEVGRTASVPKLELGSRVHL